MRPLLCFCSVLLAACHPGTTGDDAGNDSGQLGGHGLGTCADLAVACGTLGEADASIPCGSCFFDRVKIGGEGTGHVSMVSTPEGVVVARYENGQVLLSRELSDGGYATQTVDDARPNYPVLSLAVGGDQVAHLAYARDFDIWLATSVSGGLPDGGAFTYEKVVSGNEPSLALDPVGQPHVAYQQANFNTKSIRHAERGADGGWQTSQVELIDAGFMGVPKILFDPSGGAHILYIVDRSNAQDGMHHASGGTIEVVTPGGLGGGALGQLDAVYDPSGTLHALWPAYPFSLTYGRRTASGWAVTAASTDNAGHENNALAVDAQGRPVVVFHNFSSLKLAAFNGEAFSVQGVLACDQGGVSLAFDPSHRLRLASGCGSMSVLTLNGHYPDDHAAKCSQIVAQVCTLACGDCKSSSGDCCMTATGTSTCTNRCDSNIGGRACDDATKPAALTDQCVAPATTLMCANPATSGVNLRGTACDALFAPP